MKREKAIVSMELAQALAESLDRYKITFVTAPAGWGKTAVALTQLKGRECCYLSAAEGVAPVWPETAKTVILDDFQWLMGQEARQDFLERARRAGQRFVLLSRGALPPFLTTFRLAGEVQVLERGMFALTNYGVNRMLDGYGVTLAPEEVQRLHQETGGYPVLVKLLCLELAAGKGLDSEMLQRENLELYAYYDEAIFRRWSRKTQRMMLATAFFDRFTAELAGMLTGDSGAGEVLEVLAESSGILSRKGKEFAIGSPYFRRYFRYKAERTFGREEINSLYSIAGLYYEGREDVGRALACYAACGNQDRVCSLLIDNANRQVGAASYRQARAYYLALPKEKILAEPELMSGMSMLCSLYFEPEQAEYWYGQLEEYGGRLEKDDPQLKAVRAHLAQLDVTLPHRGGKDMMARLTRLQELSRGGGGRLPEMSVTSNQPSVLNGGMDLSALMAADRQLYDAMGQTVESVLGRMGVGLADIALTESLYEKGEDISERMLVLSSRQMEIQQRGAPDLEFVLVGLQAKAASQRGNAARAVKVLRDFRIRMEEQGQSRLLANIDGMLCRMSLMVDSSYAGVWFEEQAPDENDFFILDRYCYLTKARCYLKRGDHLSALHLLGVLLTCFTRYDRPMYRTETLVLLAICRYRMGGEDWQEYLTQALETGRKYHYVVVFAREGVALQPLINRLEWEGDPRYLGTLRTAVRESASQHPNYLAAAPVKIEQLSRMEVQVLRLICQNKSNDEICAILNISINTLKSHIRRMFAKLGAKNRNEARQIAQQMGLGS